MKKITPLLFCTAFFCLCFNRNYAQKIYQSKINAEYSIQTSSNESRLMQLVHQQFATNQYATIVDFTAATSGDATAFRQTLKPFLKTQDLFSITNAEGLKSVAKNYPQVLTLVLPYKNSSLVIDLVQSDIFTGDFKLYTDKNPEGVLVENGAHYKGVIRGQKSTASISIFDKRIEGYIVPEKSSSIEISKLHGDNITSQHAVYADEDLLVKGSGHYCSELMPPKSEMLQQYKGGGENTPAAQKKCVTNYWETSYNLFQYYGSVKNVNNFLTSLFNVYATIYTNENIGMQLSAAFVWTGADPYHDDLNAFSTGRTNFNANLAMLLSSSAYGGVAWLNTLCQTSDLYRHSYCGSILLSTVLPVTTYNWPANVTTHEVGHNLGSPHTHACAWNGNNTAIDGCGPAAGYSEGCNAAVPPAGGTVMSYCHLLSVGTNLTLGFGPQPGNLIRANVNTCIIATCQPIGTNCLAPANVAASKIVANAATVSWKAVKGAAYYYIYISADNGATFTLAANNLYGNTFRLTGLIPNKTYLCDVWVSCGNGNYNSTRISFTTATAFAGVVEDIAKLAKTFMVYPNPVVGGRFVVTLQSGYENAVVEIVNNNQQVIAVSKTKSAVRTFNAPATHGFYFVRVTNKNEVLTEKIIAQ